MADLSRILGESFKHLHMGDKFIEPVIEESWKRILMNEFYSDYFLGLKRFLQEEKKRYPIYPPGKSIFAAFDNAPFDKVKIVVLGQDPYHGPGQAHGLCFSVNKGVKKPPSLENIFKELKHDLNIDIPRHGNLEGWARQGVLLLNATLTVRASQPGSHQGKGWEQFTDAAIKALSDLRSGLVFLLWGNYAQAKEALIDTNKHHVLKAAHPSPLSATRGFFGCRHFSKANAFLASQGKEMINWNID